MRVHESRDTHINTQAQCYDKRFNNRHAILRRVYMFVVLGTRRGGDITNSPSMFNENKYRLQYKIFLGGLSAVVIVKITIVWSSVFITNSSQIDRPTHPEDDHL